MEKVGRNDPCPCGSGKKFKQCCETSKTFAITEIIEGEVIQLKQQIMLYATENYEYQIDNVIEGYLNRLNIDDDDLSDQIGFILMVWTIFTLPIAKNYPTIAQEFIQKNGRKIKRPVLQKSLESWQYSVPSIFKVIEEDTNNIIKVEDIFTQEEKQIHLIGSKDFYNNGNSMQDLYVIGTVIDYANRSSFFMTAYVIKEQQAEAIEEVLAFYDLHREEFPDEEFMEELLPEVLEILIHDPNTIETIEWDKPQQKQVIDLFIENLHLPEDMETTIKNIGITLWKLYCMKTDANIRSIPNYAAGLHYLAGYFCEFFGEDQFEKEELANLYNIKTRALSDTINKLERVLENEIDDMMSNVTFGFEEDDDYDDEDDEYDFLLDDEDDEDEYEYEYDLFNTIDIGDDLFNESSENPETEVVDELALRRKAKQAKKNKK